ncbi:flippase-like domain-containing protein [Candidatus Poribacteria bacterium]|nr:flippase-like domain-containing protein [Candidatus Poribacteria bacterium]
MKIGGKEYRIKTGIIIFLAISTISAMILFYRGFDSDTWQSLKQIKPIYGFLAAVTMLLYFVFNGLRFQILIKGLDVDVKFWDSSRAFIANLFLGAVTPFQTGGGPLQIYILNKAGVPLAKAFSGCLMGAMLTIFSLVGSTIVIMAFNPNLGFNSGSIMKAVFSTVSITFVIALTLFVLSLVKMDLLKKIIAKSLNFITRGKTSFTEKVMGGLDQYSESMAIYRKARKITILFAGLLTFGTIALLCIEASVILAGLNVQHNVPEVFLTQFVLNFIVYFSPTPGGSGIAELSSYHMMGDFAEDLLEIYIIAWRFFTNFLGVTLGGLIVLDLLRKEGKRKAVSN